MERSLNSTVIINNTPERFYLCLDDGSSFKIDAYFNATDAAIPFEYEKQKNSVVITSVSPIIQSDSLTSMTKEWEMGPAKVRKTSSDSYEISIQHDKPLGIAKLIYSLQDNEVVDHYGYRNASFFLFIPLGFLSSLVLYFGGHILFRLTAGTVRPS